MFGYNFMTDVDLLRTVATSHQSSILNFRSMEEAKKAVEKLLEIEAFEKKVFESRKKATIEKKGEPSDTFKEIEE